ncbi:MAG: mechanosensitive ion channel domain-containing protein [Rubritalea sp.]|uniref:mechanosensitive ion channel family protein n=1 Tax=Rubritalea sp. TaxID=2109375 RepID=UPI0032424388
MPESWESINVWYRSGAIIVAGIFAHLVFKLFVLRALEKISDATTNDLDDRLVYFIKRFHVIVLTFALFLLLLQNHGIAITPFLASAGIAGIAIGLAAKETLSDILSGIFLIADRPIRIGDRIKIERPGKHWGGWGDVTEIGLRRTQIRNSDGIILDYPNSVLANSVITNFSYLDKPVRVRVRFQVNYNADLDHVERVAKAAINSTPTVIANTADIVVRGVWDDDRGHQLSGVLVEGRYFIEDVRNRTRVRSQVLRNLIQHLNEANIPFATQRMRISPEEGSP